MHYALSIEHCALCIVNSEFKRGIKRGMPICLGYLPVSFTFVMNMRYMLMSFSLTQKINQNIPWYQRCVIAMGICDEVFVLASMEEKDIEFPFPAAVGSA